VDLIAACDAVWHQGLILKLLQTIPDRHLVRFIVKIISNRSFILKTNDGQCSHLRRLKNGVPQGSTLAPMLFNIYICDIPDTVSTQYGYADDLARTVARKFLIGGLCVTARGFGFVQGACLWGLSPQKHHPVATGLDLALLFSHKFWSEVEEVLSLDMQRVAEYLSAWRLRLSTAKTTCTAFHLNNRKYSRKLAVTVNGTTIPFTQNPTYLGVTLDRQLTFRQTLEGLCGKVTARNCILRLSTSLGWLNMGCPRLCSTHLSAGSSLVPQHPHQEARCCVKQYNAHHLGMPETDL